MKNTNATVALVIIFGGAVPITAIGSKNGKIVAPSPMIPSPSSMPYPPPSVAQSSAKSGKERLRLRSATLCDLLDAAATPAAAAERRPHNALEKRRNAKPQRRKVARERRWTADRRPSAVVHTETGFPRGGPVFSVIGIEDFTGDGKADVIAGASNDEESEFPSFEELQAMLN